MKKEQNHTTNDQNFKNLLMDYPHDSLKFFAEDEAENINESVKIIPVRQEQLKDRISDRFHELDTPLLAEWPEPFRTP